MPALFAFASGLVFGIGLLVCGLANPAKVLAFLDVAGAWDPSLLVVMGVGVRPRTDLAEAAGLKVDRGILVDERFRASNDRIYAVGDVARFPWGGENVRIEHFSVAERQGRAAAFAMLKRALEIRDVPFFWSAHHDVTISYVGHAERFDEVVVKGDLDARDAVIGYLEGGRVRAIATINRDATSLRAEHAFEDEDQTTLRSLLA